jgi:hypothetical protein
MPTDRLDDAVDGARCLLHQENVRAFMLNERNDVVRTGSGEPQQIPTDDLHDSILEEGKRLNQGKRRAISAI